MKKQLLMALAVTIAAVFVNQSTVYAHINYRALKKDGFNLKALPKEGFDLKALPKDGINLKALPKENSVIINLQENVSEYFNNIKVWLQIDSKKFDFVESGIIYQPADKNRTAYPVQKARIAYPVQQTPIAYPTQKAPIKSEAK